MIFIENISWLLTLAYAILMEYYRSGWKRQDEFFIPVPYQPYTRLSIIIPARNEEANIARCIQSILQQDYPKDLYEIIVVDDHSTDKTAQIIQSFTSENVRYINLAEHIQNTGNVVAYKKLALTTGIAQSTGEVIITTDADCTSMKQWLKDISAMYEQENPVMIAGPVDFTNNSSLVQVFQSLDFMSMQGITVATLQWKLGNMCNGANLAFSRDAFEKVGGYKGVDHLASGDDYLLMMKLNKAYPGSISYLKSEAAIVKTPPQNTWRSFLEQRIRWASKSGKYDDKKMTAVLLLVYLFNLWLVVLLILGFLQPEYFLYLGLITIIKILFELWYLIPVASFFGKRKQLWVFPLLQPLHIIYIVIAGFLGFVGVYSWKGRKVK